MERISEFISQNDTLLIAVLTLAFVLFFAAAEKKRKLPLLSLIITVLALAGFVIFCFFRERAVYGIPLPLLAAGLIAIAFLANIVIYAVNNAQFYKRLNLVRFAVNSVGSKIYAYLDEKARIIEFTEEFAELVGAEKNKKTELEEAISKIMVDSQEMALNVFAHYVRTQEERDYRVILTLANGKSVQLELRKRKVIYSGKLLGYVLMTYGGSVAMEAEHNGVLYNYLELLGEPVFFYDFRSRRYVLTREMMNLLGVSENLLGENNFLSAVVPEDLPLISGRSIGERPQKLYYRLKTTKGNVWFEESNVQFEGQRYLIAHKTDFSALKANFLEEKALHETIRLIYERNNWVGIALVKITNHRKIKQQVGTDAGDVLITRLFLQLGEQLGWNNPKIYRLEDSVFAFILDRPELRNRVLALLSNPDNVLAKAEVDFNEAKYKIEGAAGIIGSENAEDSRPETIIRDAYEALQLAEDPKYPQNFAIYSPKPKINFDLEEQGIDLSDDFLSSILKE